MMIFEYRHSSEPGALVRHEISEDASIYEACEAFEAFLRGAGYGMNGHIVYEGGLDVTH